MERKRVKNEKNEARRVLREFQSGHERDINEIHLIMLPWPARLPSGTYPSFVFMRPCNRKQLSYPTRKCQIRDYRPEGESFIGAILGF